MIIIAQANLDQVPAEPFKWILITLIGLLLVAVAIIAIIKSFSKSTTNILPDPLRTEKAAKRYNHDLGEQRYKDTLRRIESHDAEINTLWSTLREEDQATRAEMQDTFGKISRSLGRIEGRMGITEGEI